MWGPGHTGAGAGPPGAADPRARAPPVQQVGAGQGRHDVEVLLRQQRESHRLRAHLRGAPPVYLRAARWQQLEHTALPPPRPEVMFTVSPPQPPGELCSPTAGEEEEPVSPQRGGGGRHELGLLEAVSVLERVPQWTSAEGGCCRASVGQGMRWVPADPRWPRMGTREEIRGQGLSLQGNPSRAFNL